MMKSICALLFLLFSIYIVNAQDSDVVVLNTQNFDELTKEGSWLVEFYAPWCGHCKRLEPTYNELATAVKGQFNVAKIDCTVERDLGSRFGIRGFPTIKYIKDGSVYEYQGERTADAFTAFMQGGYEKGTPSPIPAPAPAAPAAAAEPAEPAKPANPDAGKDTIVLREDNFHAQVAKGEWLVKFYAPWCGHCKRLAPIFDEAATELKDIAKLAKVDCTVHKGVCDAMMIRGYPTLIHFKDGQMREYESGRSTEAFKKFIEEDHKTVTATPIPEPPSAMMRQFNAVLHKLELLLQANVWLVLGFSALVGVLLGLLVICLVPTGKSKPAAPAKKKTAAKVDEDEEDEDEKEEASKKDD